MTSSLAQLKAPKKAIPCLLQFLIQGTVVCFILLNSVTNLYASPAILSAVEVIDATSGRVPPFIRRTLDLRSQGDIPVAVDDERYLVETINTILRENIHVKDTIVIFVPISHSRGWELINGYSHETSEEEDSGVKIKVVQLSDEVYSELSDNLKTAQNLKTTTSLSPDPWDFKNAKMKTLIKGAFLIPMIMLTDAALSLKLAIIAVDLYETYRTTVNRKWFDHKLFESSWLYPLKKLGGAKNSNSHQTYDKNDLTAIQKVKFDLKQTTKRVTYRAAYSSVILGYMMNFEFFTPSELASNLIIFSGFYLANSVRSRLRQTKIQDPKIDSTLDFLIWLAVPFAYFDLLTNSLARNVSFINGNSWIFEKLFELNLKIPFTEIVVGTEFRPFTVAAIATLYAAALTVYLAPEKLTWLADYRARWQDIKDSLANRRTRQNFKDPRFAARDPIRRPNTDSVPPNRTHPANFYNGDINGWPTLEYKDPSPKPTLLSKAPCQLLFSL